MERRKALGILGAAGASLAAANIDAGHPQPAAGGQAGHGGAGGAGAARFMTPITSVHAHFCGIHIAKRDPQIQIIAQHYCAPLGDEMHQCLLYDSHERNAKLLGVEYIVSDRIYRGLPDDEKKYWHPHTYEVLSGGLISPGMRPEDELRFMRAIITTWGKTWHTWPDPRTPVPMGEPLLMWALTGDNQVQREVIERRDRMFMVNGQRIREARIAEFGFEVPQVALPRDLNHIGRQWTDTGEDRPTRRPQR
jgi:hypothetical protein